MLPFRIRTRQHERKTRGIKVQPVPLQSNILGIPASRRALGLPADNDIRRPDHARSGSGVPRPSRSDFCMPSACTELIASQYSITFDHVTAGRRRWGPHSSWGSTRNGLRSSFRQPPVACRCLKGLLGPPLFRCQKEANASRRNMAWTCPL